MTKAEIEAVVLRALGAIAPEADLTHLAPDAELTEALDIDSMDFLNFVVALHRELGIDIPETAYPELRTLGGASRYLAARSAA